MARRERQSAAAAADDDYMRPEEFAALPSAVIFAVWDAAKRGQIDWVPVDGQGTMRRYHRRQVLALAEAVPAGSLRKGETR